MTHRKHYLAVLVLCLFAKTSVSQAPKYIRVSEGYLMVLKQGDSLFPELEHLAVKEHIPSASFSGIGFADVEFGLFNSRTKKYRSKTFNELEIASLEGSIAWQNGAPSIHAHGVGANKHFRAFAGHILSAKVGTGSLEILITLHNKKLERVKDEPSGANILELKN